jgi:predicted small lipoprotein YifL
LNLARRIALLVVVLAALAAYGCANPLYQPYKDCVEGVLPDYQTYVEANAKGDYSAIPKLDKAQMERRVREVKSHQSVLAEYDKKN